MNIKGPGDLDSVSLSCHPHHSLPDPRGCSHASPWCQPLCPCYAGILQAGQPLLPWEVGTQRLCGLGSTCGLWGTPWSQMSWFRAAAGRREVSSSVTLAAACEARLESLPLACAPLARTASCKLGLLQAFLSSRNSFEVDPSIREPLLVQILSNR